MDISYRLRVLRVLQTDLLQIMLILSSELILYLTVTKLYRLETLGVMENGLERMLTLTSSGQPTHLLLPKLVFPTKLMAAFSWKLMTTNLNLIVPATQLTQPISWGLRGCRLATLTHLELLATLNTVELFASKTPSRLRIHQQLLWRSTWLPAPTALESMGINWALLHSTQTLTEPQLAMLHLLQASKQTGLPPHITFCLEPQELFITKEQSSDLQQQLLQTGLSPFFGKSIGEELWFRKTWP